MTFCSALYETLEGDVHDSRDRGDWFKWIGCDPRVCPTSRASTGSRQEPCKGSYVRDVVHRGGSGGGYAAARGTGSCTGGRRAGPHDLFGWWGAVWGAKDVFWRGE